MTTYNTGNPIGSTEVKDLYDNAQNFDVFANSTTLESSPDRFGVERLTIHGFEEEAKRLFESIKFQPPIPYAPGIEVTTSSLTVDYLGVIYYALPSALPFTTGAWNPAQWSPLQNTNPGNELLVFNDYASASAAAATLPDGQLIESPNADGRLSRFEVQGSSLVFKDYAPDVIRMPSYAALRAYTGNSPVVDVTGTGVAGRFAFDPADTTTADNGGTVIVGAGGRRWKRLNGSLIERSWFESDVAFNTASSGKPNVNASGEFNATVRPFGGQQKSLSSALQYSAAGPRCRMEWAGALAVSVTCPNVVMGGFRMAGRPQNAIGPIFPAASSNTTLSLTTDIIGGMARTNSNWYAAFAVANAGDSICGFKLVPFLKAKSVSGSVVTLGMCGEDSAIATGGITSASYAWATNALAGTQCLVITEGANGYFSWRITNITANNGTTVTLATIGAVAAKSLLLPAPPGFSFYNYLGSFYLDTAEVRNISDEATGVTAKMVDISFYHGNDGSLPTYLNGVISSASPKKIDCTGFISPLATSVLLQASVNLPTSSTGSYAMDFTTDSSNHVVFDAYFQKNTTGTETYVSGQGKVGFAFGPQYYVQTGGTVASASTSARNNIVGWVEP